ncbi:putative flap endonuclease 1 [Vanrija pseudolonga]|uniref:Exonuclease 1 n=1 Tax=Vanrija pseudolonga TaxID=143232 RepID=A0AAF0YBS8_9TREE|nr:putative flap endonuclease 1 [Vanrija pseudolonga]
MGVQGLITWVKKTRPELLTSLPERYASPTISGKRIALDATLITNKFHFADKSGGQSRRAALHGWYGLIKQMRAQGVLPVAVWDERGDREWKAPEARRRLQARALVYARRLHEDRRRARLDRLLVEFDLLAGLTAQEKAVVQRGWATGFAPSPSSHDPAAAIKPHLESSTISSQLPGASAPGPAVLSPHAMVTAFVSGRTAAQLARLHALREDYAAELNPEARETLLEAYDSETAAIQQIGGPCGDIGRLTGTLADADTDVIDARFESLAPATAYSETPRQQALTDQEGEVWANLFATEPALSPAALRTATKTTRRMLTQASTVAGTYARALNWPLADDHQACCDLLLLMGVPVLTANIPYEAEGLAAALANAGAVDYVGSEDSDVVVYGGPLLRNVATASEPLVLVSAGLDTALGLPRAAFIDFCILLGTDASPRIPGVGPARALPLIKKYGCIEGMLAAEPEIAERIDDLDAFLQLVENARVLFTTVPPLPDGIEFQQGAYDEAEVLEWLRENGVVEPDRPARTWSWSAPIEEMPEHKKHETWDESWAVPTESRREPVSWEEMDAALASHR